ncbi:MAG TPA: adenylate/guanylate cyclase domain-containing protein [Geminicoccaceae bacterium]|nr:adenylate/guanylate cyclase domain-containing protein [Geminicoccaceae bacterium]
MSPRGSKAARGWRVSLATFQGLMLGGLIFLSMAALLFVSLNVAFRNTTELLEDKSRLIIALLRDAVARYLDAAEAQLDYIGGLIERGELDPDELRRLYEILGAGLAATPQVYGVIMLDARGWSTAAFRDPAAGGRIIRKLADWQDDPLVAAAMAAATTGGVREAFWGPPVYTGDAGTVLNLRRPVHKGGNFIGLIVAVIRTSDFSSFVASLETEPGQNAFVLHGRHHVLAHRALENGFDGGPNRPLPTLSEIGDPVLSDIWSEGWQQRRLEIGSGHQTPYGSDQYVILYEPLADYTDAPWLVGSYFRDEQIGQQVIRFVLAAVIGVVGLLLSMVMVFLVARIVRRPLTRLAGAAGVIRELDLDRVPLLARSRLRELDDAASAFNAMVAGLRAFALYVPRNLVLSLVGRGDVTALPSETRDVSVLFSDIVGFTARTEQLGAQATAEFLNHHFSLVTAHIEAEGGKRRQVHWRSRHGSLGRARGPARSCRPRCPGGSRHRRRAAS